MDIIDWLKRARSGRLWPVLAVGYEVLARTQLGVERVLDSFLTRPVRAPELEHITVVIKTFERPSKLRRLVGSIRRQYPGLTIVVADDSKNPSQLPEVETVVLPFDSGVSAGRNAGLAQVKTDYVLLLDDDYVFYRHTDVLNAFKKLSSNPAIDILAGQEIYLPLRHSPDYSVGVLYSTDREPLVPQGALIDGLPVLKKVPNFYIGRTEKVREVGWDDSLKRVDHADFFTRAVGVLVCVQDVSFRVLHYPSYFDRRYLGVKRDVEQDRERLRVKYWG